MQNVLFENHIFRSLEPNSFVLHCVLHTALNDKAVKSLNSKTVERSPVKALQKVNECQKSNCICTYICICICIVFVIEITQFKDCWEWSMVIALQRGRMSKVKLHRLHFDKFCFGRHYTELFHNFYCTNWCRWSFAK